MLVSSGDSLLSALDCADPVFTYSTFSTHCVRILSTMATSHVPGGYSSTVLKYASLLSSRVTQKNRPLPSKIMV